MKGVWSNVIGKAQTVGKLIYVLHICGNYAKSESREKKLHFQYDFTNLASCLFSFIFVKHTLHHSITFKFQLRHDISNTENAPCKYMIYDLPA